MKTFLKNKLIKNYTITTFYGGFGNNLQQLAIGVMYANFKNINFYSKSHELVEDIQIINNQFSGKLKKFRHGSRFYHYDNLNEKFVNYPDTDWPLEGKDYQYFNTNFYDVFQKIIEPRLNFRKNIDIDDETLVIHVRSGDIFAKKNNKIIGNYYYLQNPIVYYEQLIQEYKKTILVSDSPFNNPVIKFLKKDSRVDVVSSNLAEDFNILLNARNLATSGVGTFASAAALSSKKLKNLYYSNLYFKHHLNPSLVRNVNHHQYEFDNYYNIGSVWTGNEKQVNKMLSEKVIVRKLEP